ncbi:MAG: MFS transporter [Bdellovibrionota bacterium]
MRFLLNLRLFRALSHRPIFILWSGEAFSAIGDEIYKVALIWIAVKLIGSNAGYLAAAQAAAVLVFSLVGGYWADRWDPRRTMLMTDLVRALIVLVPVVWSWFYPLNLFLLLFVAISIAALSAFFEPAMHAVIPRLAPSKDLRQATNGLMGTTPRLARAIGPSIVGLLTGIFPMIHFFTLDAVSFLFSTIAVSRLKNHLPPLKTEHEPRKGLLGEIFSGFRLIRGDSLMQYILYGKAVASGCWSVINPLGMAVLVQQILPGDIRAYGFLLASYGVGNFAAALFLSNVTMNRPMRVMVLGHLLMGITFAVMPFMPNIYLMMLCAAVAAVGGPMNDLAHIDVIQNRYPPQKLVRIVRFRMAIEFAGMFLCLLTAPLCFQLLNPQKVIAIAGTVMALTGILGLLRFQET